MSVGRTRFALIAVGAIGLAAVARAGLFYLHVDRIAFALAILIGAGFAVGIAELLARVARVGRVADELARMPRPATEEAIAAASPALRSVLQARLGGVRAAVPTAAFTSYLVGLLVMVGLLGTFLGLVDALRGTRDALGASGDIDALRAALATPMQGLGRAFGISAAGLVASALLGLAAVFARRAEVALGLLVHAYGDAELGSLTVAERALDLAQRQLAATERQEALAARQLDLLETMAKESAASAAASARATEAVLAATAAVRSDVAAGVQGIGRAVEQTLTPALEQAVARASDATRERLEAWSEVVERDAKARRERDAELAHRWSELAGESAARVAHEGGRALGELRGALGESLVTLEAKLDTSVEGLVTRLAARSAASTDDLERRLGELTSAVSTMVRGLAGELDATRARLDRTLASTSEAIEAQSARSLARDEGREAAIATRTEELAAAESKALAHLERHVATVDAALAAHLGRLAEAQGAATQAASERATQLEATLREHATSLTTRTADLLGAASRRAEAAAETAERVAAARSDEEQARAARAEATAREQAARAEATAREQAARAEATTREHEARTQAVLAGLEAATQQIARRTGEVLEAQHTRQAELEVRWLAAHEASASRIVALLEGHASGIDQGLAATRALVDEAAGLLRASGVEMGAVAEVFTAAVDRYRDASAASLQALSSVDDAVDRAGKKAAVELLTDYLDQTREVFDHSLEVQRELFAELRALRSRGQTTPPESTRVRV